MLTLVQFRDNTYGLRMDDWFIPGTTYWNFVREEWVSGAYGVNSNCRSSLEKAQEMKSFLEDGGKPI